MRRFIAVAVCVLCVAVVFLGRMYWQHQIATVGAKAQQQLHNNGQASNPGNLTDEEAPGDQTDGQPSDLHQLTKDLPDLLADNIQEAVETETPLQFLIVTRNDAETWPSLLQDHLDESYGEGVFHISTQTYGEQTTFDFLENDSYESLFQLPEETDLLLFESLILNDQQIVRTEDTLIGVRELYEAVTEEHSDLTFLLQPPNPVYQHPYYAEHVAELRDFAKEEGIPYINVWQAWPDVDDDDLLNYLNEEGNIPSEEGNELWADALADYFTSDLSESSER